MLFVFLDRRLAWLAVAGCCFAFGGFVGKVLPETPQCWLLFMADFELVEWRLGDPCARCLYRAASWPIVDEKESSLPSLELGAK